MRNSNLGYYAVTKFPRHIALKDAIMAKSQMKSNKETRKPKAEKEKKPNASNPSTKPAAVGIVNIKG